MCIVVIFAAMTLAAPQVGAFGDTEILSDNTVKNSDVMGAIGNGNIGIQTNGAVKDNTFNTGTATVGDITNLNTNLNTNFNTNKAYGGDGGDASVKNSGNSVNTIGNATSVFGDANSGLINENDLSNKNTVLNTNLLGQDQDQDQDQKQKQKQKQDQDQEQDQVQGQGQAQAVDIDQTFEAAEIPRQFAIGADIIYPGTPTYMGPATNQPNYLKADTFLMFQKSFTREYVEAAQTSHTASSWSLKRRFHYFTGTKAKDARKASDSLTVTIAKPTGKVRVVGYYNIWSKSVNRDSLDVFFNALEEMMNVEGGANTVWLTGEGAMSIVKSFGWGIGLNYTQAFVTADNKQSGSGTGGTGISGGEAGYRAKPWMQFQLLIVE